MVNGGKTTRGRGAEQGSQAEQPASSQEEAISEQLGSLRLRQHQASAAPPFPAYPPLPFSQPYHYAPIAEAYGGPGGLPLRPLGFPAGLHSPYAAYPYAAGPRPGDRAPRFLFCSRFLIKPHVPERLCSRDFACPA